MNSVQVAVAQAIKLFAPFSLTDCIKRAKGVRELAAINMFAITTHVQNMFVVTELLTSHDVTDSFARPVSFCVGSICCVTRPYGREKRTRVVEVFHNFLLRQS